jgi:hypothetical protein
MSAINKTRTIAGIAAALGAAALGVASLAGPASAGPSDSDRPKVTERHHDFGEHWTVSAPRNGGHLEWQNSNGLNTVTLTGYHYLTDEECGLVHVEYYNGSHTLLGTDESGLHCAPDNGKTQWFVSESFSSSTVEHVHVELEDGSGTFIGSDTEDFD